jgi:hypothetical protein
MYKGIIYKYTPPSGKIYIGPKINSARNKYGDLGYSLGNFSTYCNGKNNNVYKGYKYYRGNPPDNLINDTPNS